MLEACTGLSAALRPVPARSAGEGNALPGACHPGISVSATVPAWVGAIRFSLTGRAVSAPGMASLVDT